MTKTIKIWAICIVLCLLSFSKLVAQDQIQYKEYSYTEFFKMIEDEEYSVFRLSNALIRPNAKTDQYFLEKVNPFISDEITLKKTTQDSIYVNKELVLNNVQFFNSTRNTSDGAALLHHISFEKKVTLSNVTNIIFAFSTFKEGFESRLNNNMLQLIENAPRGLQHVTLLGSCSFQQGLQYFSSGLDNNSKIPGIFLLRHSTINQGNNLIDLNNKQIVYVTNNLFKGLQVIFTCSTSNGFVIEDNNFDINYVSLEEDNGDSGKNTFYLSNNSFDGFVGLGVQPEEASVIKWPEFNGRAIMSPIFYNLKSLYDADSVKNENPNVYDKKYLNEYFERIRVENEDAFKAEQRIKGRFINLYRSQNDLDYANMVYVESKDLETARLAYLYTTDPHFNTFFSWKINQFLKIFSAYGTEPARAITFSVYVILVFALVYLFFPNYWDSYGKSRLKHRFSFFYKYMSLNAGIQDVYLEENKAEIEDNEAFKSLLVAHKEQAPKLFFNLAMPLYRWSMAGTLTYAWLIKRFDFLKGTWKDTDAKTRGLKSFLIGTMFIIALLYDIFIKMLNALMLSINTFTTLGFGEIPIKGLPRYLAIIQGFIGWFMLTIFSVSLISQLLN